MISLPSLFFCGYAFFVGLGSETGVAAVRSGHRTWVTADLVFKMEVRLVR